MSLCFKLELNSLGGLRVSTDINLQDEVKTLWAVTRKLRVSVCGHLLIRNFSLFWCELWSSPLDTPSIYTRNWNKNYAKSPSQKKKMVKAVIGQNKNVWQIISANNQSESHDTCVVLYEFK